ncbi:hypothetical protein D9M70_588270 [compost metagenome]
MAAQGLGHRTEGAAEVIEHAVRLGEAGAEQADVLDDGRVARRGALDHVRENAHHVFIEGEVGNMRLRLGKDTVWLAHAMWPRYGGAGVRRDEQAGVKS